MFLIKLNGESDNIWMTSQLSIMCTFIFLQGSVKEMLNLSQQDYVKRIEELNQALVTAWEGDQRVKALKIVIQVITLRNTVGTMKEN